MLVNLGCIQQARITPAHGQRLLRQAGTLQAQQVIARHIDAPWDQLVSAIDLMQRSIALTIAQVAIIEY